MAKQEMTDSLDCFERGAVEETNGHSNNARATSLVSMSKEEKDRLTRIAKSHGLSLSAFFRLAADEYITKHNW